MSVCPEAAGARATAHTQIEAKNKINKASGKYFLATLNFGCLCLILISNTAAKANSIRASAKSNTAIRL